MHAGTDLISEMGNLSDVTYQKKTCPMQLLFGIIFSLLHLVVSLGIASMLPVSLILV